MTMKTASESHETADLKARLAECRERVAVEVENHAMTAALVGKELALLEENATLKARLAVLRQYVSAQPCKCQYMGDGDTLQCGRCVALEDSAALQCTGCVGVTKPICGHFAEQDDGEGRVSHYCATCGHSNECHEPVSRR